MREIHIIAIIGAGFIALIMIVGAVMLMPQKTSGTIYRIDVLSKNSAKISFGNFTGDCRLDNVAIFIRTGWNGPVEGRIIWDSTTLKVKWINNTGSHYNLSFQGNGDNLLNFGDVITIENLLPGTSYSLSAGVYSDPLTLSGTTTFTTES